jgi:hypothetical protein
MAQVLWFNTHQTSSIHQHNMMDSLAYRLKIARAAKNTPLIELLEQERRQIAVHSTGRKALNALGVWLNAFKQKLDKIFFGGSTLQVSEFNLGSDHWWYAFDPRTGECVYADSEVELRLWIKKNYRGA